MNHVDDYIAKYIGPGRGYGWGHTPEHATSIAKRAEGETAGVAWTRLIVLDHWNGERETVYLTESGHKVERMTGGYGSGVRWGVTGPGLPSIVCGAANLPEAFGLIAQAAQAGAA